MSEITVCLIGTGAVRVNPERAGPAFLVEAAGENVLVDCGRGAVTNIELLGYEVRNINKVFVTHLHFDHVCDLPLFVLLSWNNGRQIPLEFFGPPGLADFLENGILKAYSQDIRSRLGHGKDPHGIEWKVTEVDNAGIFFATGDLRMSALPSPHANMPNLNVAIETGGKRVVITSDTSPDPGLSEFCRNADVLLCECSGTHEFLDSVPWGAWHLWPEKIAELCREAAVKHVVLKHIVVEDWSEDERIAENMADAVRAGFAGRVTLGYDGLRVGA